MLSKDEQHHFPSVQRTPGRWRAFKDGVRIERTGTVVIGASQAGLSAAHFLKRAGAPHVLLERGAYVGSAWVEQRWDSFRLVTENSLCNLPGFPATVRPQAAGVDEGLLQFSLPHSILYGKALYENKRQRRMTCALVCTTQAVEGVDARGFMDRQQIRRYLEAFRAHSGLCQGCEPKGSHC